MEYINFWSGFGLGFLCFISLGYAIYKDAENKADKVIEDIYQDIEVNEKPHIRARTTYIGYKVWLCKSGCGVSMKIGSGFTPVEAYQNYKSMCYNKDTY